MKTSNLEPHSFCKVMPNLNDEEFKSLKNDIEKNGIKQPLDISEDNEILDGYHRFKIAKELKIDKVPTNVIKIKNEKEKKLWIIKSNLLRRQLSTTQKYILYAEISKLYEVGKGGDRRSKGFKFQRRQNVVFENGIKQTAKAVGENERTINRARRYVRSIKKYPDLKKFDSPLSTINEAKRRDDIEKREKKTLPKLKNLLLGNCLEKVDEIEDRSIDVMITDPPYGIGKKWGRGQTIRMREDWDFPYENGQIFGLLDVLFKKAKSKLKPDSLIYIFTSWRIWHKLFPIATKYFKFKSCLCWIRHMALEGSGKRNYRNCYDLIFFGSNDEERYLKGNLKNVFDGIEKEKMLHPAQKPVELIKKFIRHSTVKNETVFDPFCGSGTTLVAAESLERNWIGMEIEKRWYDIARERIAKIRNE